MKLAVAGQSVPKKKTPVESIPIIGRTPAELENAFPVAGGGSFNQLRFCD